MADPIAATLGVVVFSAVVAGHANAGHEIFQFLRTLGIGAGFGLAGAALVMVNAMVATDFSESFDRDRVFCQGRADRGGPHQSAGAVR